MVFEGKKGKEAEEALRRSEEKYSSLFQFCSDCIIVHDFNGRIVEFNRKACEIFGYSSEELKEVSILELHCNQTAEKLQAGMTKIHDEAFQHFEAAALAFEVDPSLRN